MRTSRKYKEELEQIHSSVRIVRKEDVPNYSILKKRRLIKSTLPSKVVLTKKGIAYIQNQKNTLDKKLVALIKKYPKQSSKFYIEILHLSPSYFYLLVKQHKDIISSNINGRKKIYEIRIE